MLYVESAAGDALLYRVNVMLNASYKEVFFLDIRNKYSTEIFKTHAKLLRL
jgi:hypothetical protein